MVPNGVMPNGVMTYVSAHDNTVLAMASPAVRQPWGAICGILHWPENRATTTS
jgi:hypothetical protein